MVFLTQLPTRKLAQTARIISQDRDSDMSSEPSISELLSRVRIEFERDEEKMASNLLHYQDVVIQESQHQEAKVQFDVPYETTEPDDEQCKTNRRVYPPTPARPSMETLAKLMEVSYTDWSQSSYDDTSADSKLAEWLASFAAKGEVSSSFEDSIRNALYKPSAKHEKSDLRGRSLAREQPSASPGSTPWRPYGRQSRSEHSSSGTRRRAVSDPVSPWFDQSHSSSTRSASASSVRRVRLQLSPIQIPSSKTKHADYPPYLHVDEDNVPNTPYIPPFSFELQTPETDTAGDTPNLSGPPSPRTPNAGVHPPLLPLDPTSPFVTQSPALEQFLSFSSALDESRPNMIQDLSVALGNALPDMSSVHAFNLSLQHASKSPFLIRTWKRMLGELTGRFPLNIGQSERQPEPIHIAESAAGTVNRNNISQGPLRTSDMSTSDVESSNALEISSETQVKSMDSVDPTLATRTSKTHADILLDREYAAHLRSSIETKQREVHMLNDLIEQRKKTIERMERVLKARALEALRNE